MVIGLVKRWLNFETHNSGTTKCGLSSNGMDLEKDLLKSRLYDPGN